MTTDMMFQLDGREEMLVEYDQVQVQGMYAIEMIEGELMTDLTGIL